MKQKLMQLSEKLVKATSEEAVLMVTASIMTLIGVAAGHVVNKKAGTDIVEEYYGPSND